MPKEHRKLAVPRSAKTRRNSFLLGIAGGLVIVCGIVAGAVLMLVVGPTIKPAIPSQPTATTALFDPTLLAQMTPVATASATPTPTVTPVTPTEIPPSPAPGPIGYVTTTGDALRLRESPDTTSDNVLGLLWPSTPLYLIGRTENSTWLQVETFSGVRGWVMSKWVTTDVPIESLPPVVVTPGQASPPTATATLVPMAITPQAPPHPEGPISYPYISNITPHTYEIFLWGQSLGNRPNVFSKVGDSITANEYFLVPIGQGNYNLEDYAYLQPVIDFFSQEIARDGNSFANTSLAAKGGWATRTVLDPASADLAYCQIGESPLVCEYRLVRPSIALIMLGTNDVNHNSTQRYEQRMRTIIETTINMGVVPVISTIPPYHNENDEPVGQVIQFNNVVKKLAQEYQIPLWDYYSAMVTLPGDGLWPDGVHPNWDDPADFTWGNLQYGMAMRNLTALQALDAVWRYVTP